MYLDVKFSAAVRGSVALFVVLWYWWKSDWSLKRFIDRCLPISVIGRRGEVIAEIRTTEAPPISRNLPADTTLYLRNRSRGRSFRFQRETHRGGGAGD